MANLELSVPITPAMDEPMRLPVSPTASRAPKPLASADMDIEVPWKTPLPMSVMPGGGTPPGPMIIPLRGP